MEHLTEIRWHGRGGQGAKTAALLLADIAFGIGKYVQGFPEYPERMGAPITAYDRISDYEIRVHSNIYEPDFVVVVDDTLLHSVDVTAGLNTKGGVLINTEKGRDEIMPLLKGYEVAVYTINKHWGNISRICRCFLPLPGFRGLWKKTFFSWKWKRP